MTSVLVAQFISIIGGVVAPNFTFPNPTKTTLVVFWLMEMKGENTLKFNTIQHMWSPY
jgi:hypothetical protein